MPNSSTRRVMLSDIAATPWKNGGGVTREIATGVSPGHGQGWGWRVSLADVAQDGPFSIFPNTDRVIAVIDGAGMDLDYPDGAVVALEPFDAVRLAGEDSLFGRLRGGPVRDLNVMVLRDQFEAVMDFRQGPCAATSKVGSGDFLLIHNVTGGCAVSLGGGRTYELAPAETLVHESQGSFDIRLTEDGRAAVIRIQHKMAPGRAAPTL